MRRRRQAWRRDYLIEEGYEPLAFVGQASLQLDAQLVAKHMREIFGVGPGWAREHGSWTDALLDLRFKVEDMGVITTWSGVVGNHTRRVLDVEEFRELVLA